MKPQRFSELDALRGFAALGVLACHYAIYVADAFHVPWSFRIGGYGPILFFVVSGFVIFWTLERSNTLLDFAVSRFSRLYPTYWAALGFWAIVSYLVHDFWWRSIVYNVTMFQEFIGWVDVDMVFWTLAVELVFYFWMAAIFSAGLLHRIVPALVVWLTVSALSVVPAIGHFLLIPRTPFWAAGIAFSLTQIPFFAAGIMFYLIRKEGWRPKYLAMIAASFAVVCIHGAPGHIVVAAIVFPVFALAVAGWLRWIVNPVTVWLGTISYALYVTHNNAGAAVLRILGKTDLSPWVAVLLVTAGALAVASFVTYCIERPAIKFIRSLYARWKSPAIIHAANAEPSGDRAV